MAPESPAYNVFCAVQLSGRLNLEALQRAINEIVRRHESLRTCFPAIDGRPAADVRSAWALDIPLDDLAAADPRIRREQVSRLCMAEADRRFDLSADPLLRARLLRLEEREHVALLTMHHIVADGWSMGVLLNELSQLYEAFDRGGTSPLPEPTVQYGDFADWQERWLKGNAAVEQRRWWKERLAGLTPLNLPTDRPRPAEPTYRGAGYAFRLPARAASALTELGRREGATLFMTLLAVFSVLLRRYTGQEDIVVGSPVANRNHRKLEPMIGFFVNSLIMRCDVSGMPSFLAVLRRVRDFALDAMARQDLPFEELVRELAPERDASSNPVFQVMFSLENWPVGVMRLPDLTLAPVEVETHVAKFDLLLNIREVAGGLVAAFEYATDLFDPDTIARMAGHFTTLLEAIAADPQADIATLPLLTAAELAQLAAWNDTTTPYPRDAGLATLFERQVRRTPDAIAVDFADARLSYAELNARANRLARRLRDCRVGAQTPVAIHAERSAALIVGLLAILKAGGCYVPLDPAYPTPRLELMLDNCRAVVLLTQRELLGRLPAAEHRVLCLDADLDGADDADPDWPPVAGGGLAYIIYTSGSTGEPKGVAVPQRAVSRLVLGSDYIALQPDDVVAQASNASFDAATFEIWGALLNGAQLVGVERDMPLAPAEFAAFLHERGITTLWLTAGLFNQHVDSDIDLFGGLRHLLIGGERLSTPHVNRVREQYPRLVLINGYGPTENTTFSTCHRIERSYPSDVPIGRPIANSTAYVLDANRELLPVGVPGELYVGGDGLAHGYLGQPELSAERFVPNPFDGGRTRLYRTGDIVRRRPEGALEFVGRRDSQVKIRGFRVEPGEIEAALVRHPAVLDGVVLAREDRPGRRELVAYVVAAPECDFDVQALRNDLARQLPGHMVPAHFVRLPALPLNENGKVDRRALPAPADVVERDGANAAPRDTREQCLADVWRGILGCREVGIHDNYFELGGDSITAIQVVSRVRRAGWRMRVADLFRQPTVAALAPCLELADDDAPAGAEPTADVPLTAVQRWFFAHYYEHLDHFNQVVLLEPSAALDERHLRHALDALARWHDALRLRFRSDGGAVRQNCTAPGEPVPLDVVDLRSSGAPPSAFEQRADEVQRGLDLARGPLFRAAWFRLDDRERLLLVIHHLAVDGVSWRILLEDLELAYRQSAGGKAIDLGAPTCSFGRWAQAMHAFATNPALAAEAPYWARIDAGGTARLPTRAAAAALRHGDAQTLHFALSPEDTDALLARAHRAFRTEIMDLLLTALGRALKAWSGSPAIRITLEGHGREPPDDSLDLSRTVGWFTSLYPFVVEVPGDDIGEQITHVKTALRELPRKGIGYGLLRYRDDTRPPATTLAPQLSFNYLGQFDGAGATGLFRFSDDSTGCAIDPRLPRAHELDVVGVVADNRLLLSLDFDPATLAFESASGLLDDFGRQLVAVARYCCDQLDHAEAARDTVDDERGTVSLIGEVKDRRALPRRESASREFTFSQLPADDFDRILQSFSDKP